MAKYEFQAEIIEAGVNHVVPSYAPFCETYLYLQESTEADWNALMFDLGIRELGVLEATGTSMVYEAEDGEATENKKNVIDKIVEFIKKQWEKVKGAFDKLIKKIQEKMAAAKEKFNADTIAKIKKNLAAGRLKETDKNGVVRTFGKFADYAGLDKLANASAKELKSEENATDVDIKVDDLKKKYRGEEFDVDRKWIEANIDKIVGFAFDFKIAKKSILTSYNDVKKGFDEEIKIVKVGKVELKQKSEHAKAQVKTLNKIASAAVQLHVEREMRALAILTKVAVGTLAKSEAEKQVAKEEKEAKKAKKEEVKESAVTESYSTEIEKLFDWNF